MTIKETKTFVIIDGNEIEGFIDGERHCNMCKSHLVFYDDFDAYFCPKCNNWMESKCTDSECEFCSSRPDRPLAIA